jgi:hypothetical protein
VAQTGGNTLKATNPWRPEVAVCGGQGRDRTADLAVFSRTLYRLSYLPGGQEVHGSCPSGPDGI